MVVGWENSAEPVRTFSAVGCLNSAKYNFAVTHADVAKLNFEVDAWNDHSNEVDIITMKECQMEIQRYLKKKHTR